jgi:hypothetical protein
VFHDVAFPVVVRRESLLRTTVLGPSEAAIPNFSGNHRNFSVAVAVSDLFRGRCDLESLGGCILFKLVLDWIVVGVLLCFSDPCTDLLRSAESKLCITIPAGGGGFRGGSGLRFWSWCSWVMVWSSS